MMQLLKDPILLSVATATTLPFLAMAVILIFTRHNVRLSCSISVGAISISLLNALIFDHTAHATARSSTKRLAA
jgi:NADH-quinone oxidoreductase subunit L